MTKTQQCILSKVHTIVNINIPNDISKPNLTTFLQKHLDSLMCEILFTRGIKGKK